MIRVSAGILQNEDGRILICQRPEGKKLAFHWEFPGGKQEKEEDDAQCLIRELHEELDLSLDPSKIEPVCTISRPQDNLTVVFLLCRPDHYQPAALEHNDLKWIGPHELADYSFCSSDQMMLDQTDHALLFDLYDRKQKIS